MKNTLATKKISDEAVAAKTGKNWQKWFKILDSKKAKDLDHKGIVAVLYKNYKQIGGWWCQMIAVSYEQERGLRKEHEKCDGQFEISVGKTIDSSIGSVFKAWLDPKICAKWLGNQKFTITKSTKDKSIRAKWSDDTRVSVNFCAKGSAKCQVVVQHMKLTEAQVNKTKSFWQKKLDALISMLEC